MSSTDYVKPGPVKAGSRPVPNLDPTRDALAGSAISKLQDLGPTHFIGIGGAGMSVLAEMLHQAGVPVSGSDREKSDKTARLEAMGITVHLGQSAQNVAGAQTVVWSSAIKADNPEIGAALAQGSRLVHRSDILALLMRSRQTVTVAGAHGKTTTSALLSHILVRGGKGDLADPSYAIGGSIQTEGGSLDGGHVGQGKVLVAEADESDGSFEKYHPTIALITNAEPDHLDHYRSPEAFYKAFIDYAHHARKYLVLCGDDQGSVEVLKSLSGSSKAKTVVYSTQERSHLETYLGDARLVSIVSESESSGSGREKFTLRIPVGLLAEAGLDPAVRTGDGENQVMELPVELSIPGLHNARNAAAAIISAILLGMDPCEAARAATDFQGASRRFEIRGEVGGVILVDDYAHHPTEIEALLDAARRRYPHKTIRVLFQPHLFSRTQFFADRFAAALNKADDVVVTGVFPARERQEDYPGIGPDTILEAWKGLDSKGHRADFHVSSDMTQGALAMADRAHPGDLIMTVGAGDITSMGQVILDRLKERAVDLSRMKGLE